MLGFTPTEEQRLIQDTVSDFARDHVRPAAHDADESGDVPGMLIEQAWQLGLVHSTIPESYGGVASAVPSVVTGALIAEALAWGDLSVALHVLAPQLVTVPVLTLGSDEQKSQVLGTYTGERFSAGSAALVEPTLPGSIPTPYTPRRSRRGESSSSTGTNASCRWRPTPPTCSCTRVRATPRSPSWCPRGRPG